MLSLLNSTMWMLQLMLHVLLNKMLFPVMFAAVHKLFQLLTGQLDEADLVLVVESEDKVVLAEIEPEVRGRG